MKKLFLYAFLSFAISSYCQTAEDYFKSGLSKLQLEDREGAIADFTKAIQLKKCIKTSTLLFIKESHTRWSKKEVKKRF